MKRPNIVFVVLLLAAFGMTGLATAAEYYVVKSRSGVLRVVDHKPGGMATVEKGPFKSIEDAQKALGELRTPTKTQPRQ